MNAMIFAAGLGTRLAPLTNTRPKALVEINGKPLLQYAIENFVEGGATQIVINVHHFAEQIITYVNTHKNLCRGVDFVISDESELLLDTGGGLANALQYFANDEPIAIGNADVLSNAPIGELYAEHVKSGRDATLITRTRNSTRQLLFDGTNRLCGWTNKTTGEVKMPRESDSLHESAFCGFHIINQDVIRDMMPVRPFPIIDAYLQCAPKFNIGEIALDSQYYWFDVGTVEKLQTATDFMNKR
ncbi:MAG: NTP transferase domain-containing protein [Bacteroidales bacterium]|nr:NTP transferase domain-containing protein [Bacteroidales bacterium]